MKVTKYKNPKGFINNFDNLFDSPFSSLFNGNLNNFIGSDDFISNPSANIKESEDGYEIELAAPGLEKKDFKLKLDQDILTVVVKLESQSKKATKKLVRREFSFSSFKRSFTLPETVAIEKIGAKYENGVLNITLPKKEEAKPLPAKEISVE